MRTVRGYIQRTTGETDIPRATLAAIKLLGELEHRSDDDQPRAAKTFKNVAAAYLRDAQTRWKEGRNSGGRYNIIKGTLNRYLMPYFGKRDITKIKKKDLMDYRAWRQEYWITGPGKDLTIYHKVKPSSATLKQEWTILRGVFSYGIEMGYVSPLVMKEPDDDISRLLFFRIFLRPTAIHLDGKCSKRAASEQHASLPQTSLQRSSRSPGLDRCKRSTRHASSCQICGRHPISPFKSQHLTKSG
jgi:hypothetical protein